MPTKLRFRARKGDGSVFEKTPGQWCASISISGGAAHRVLFTLFLAIVCAGTPTRFNVASARAPVNSGSIQLFATEAAAQAHCPRDTVVWLNTNSGIYHEKGMRWYGRTRHGAYVCRKDADAAGDRDTRNGQ